MRRCERGAPNSREGVDAAVSALEGVLGLETTLPDYYLGIAYQLTGELKKAIKHLKQAVKDNDAFYEALVELGDAYRWDGKTKSAKKAYDEALETNPEYAHGYMMRSMFFASEQKLDEAREDIDRALEIDPESVEYQMIARQLTLVIDGPDWGENGFEVESKNYHVRTNVSQEFAETIAHHAELIRRLYVALFPNPPKAKRKFPITVFANNQEYHENGGPAGAGGHFDPQFKQLFLFRYPQEQDTLIVLYHEGFHQFLDSVVDVHPPQWFNEGMADFFGPSEYVRRPTEGMMPQPNPWRLQTVQAMIQRGRVIPFEQLMRMSQQEMYDPQIAGLCYAQAWSMVYFFFQADDGAHRHYLKDYFKAIKKGKDRNQAYDRVFGSTNMAELEGRWRTFMMTIR